ncbi:MAG: RodZ domain-containing protein [Candidatus Omnitrophota bacterium]
MDKTGARLKKIRLDKGLNLEDAAKKTKVPLNILKAIEDDGFINLEPVYVKGFIKIYCNYLNVPPADFISEIKEPQVTMKLSDEEEKATTFLRPLPVRRPIIPWRLVAAVAVVVAAVFFVSLLWRNRPRDRVKPKPVAVKAVAKQKAKPVAQPQKPKAVRQPPKPATVRATEPIRNIPVSSNKDEQSGIRLGIHATDDCWMQVRVDGKIIFQSVLFRGRTESWIARDKIDLWLGSAGGVELEVNGSRIPSLGRKGQVLKNIVISKDGLKVGK